MTNVDAGAADLTAVHLDVYDTRNGPWNPEHGDIVVPDDWEFLPSGDAFISRNVKAAGRYWLSWQPRSGHRQHRRLLGLWAPSEAIRAAEQRAMETAERRAATRTVSARSRARREERYEQDLREAARRFLDFAPAHAQLAEQIATETAAHAAVVGSGRVGRTQLLTVDEKAALAARAHIRHRHTQYEDRLDTAARGMERRRPLPRDQRRRPRGGRRLPRRPSPTLGQVPWELPRGCLQDHPPESADPPASTASPTCR